MPLTIKTNALKYRKSDGSYSGINSIAESSTAEQVAAIEAAGASQTSAVQQAGTNQVASIQQKGTETLNSIPNDYTELSNEVDNLRSAIEGHEQIEVETSTVTGLNLKQNETKYLSDGNYTTKYIQVVAGKKINFSAVGSQTAPATEELRFGFTESIPANNISATYNDKIVITGSNTGTHSYTPAADGYYSVSYWTAKAPTSMLFAIEGDNLLEIVQKHTEQIEELYTKTSTDKTLTQENIPADAKTVGDKFEETDEFLYGVAKEAPTTTTKNINLIENDTKYESDSNRRTVYFQSQSYEKWIFTITGAKNGECRFGCSASEPGNNVPCTYDGKITFLKDEVVQYTITPEKDGYVSMSYYYDLIAEYSISGISGGKNKEICDNTRNVSEIKTSIQHINTDVKLKRAIDNAEVIRELNAAKKIISSNDAPFVLLHFSDIHGDSVALQRIIEDAEYIGGMDDIICTGDMVNTESTAIESWWEPTVLIAIGNHEAGKRVNGVWDYNAVPMADRDTLFIAPFEENWNIVHTSGTSYYYKDYASKNIRLIVLDVQLYLESTAETTAQTTWFANLLSDANTNGLHVLVAVHGPSVGGSCLECSFNKNGYTGTIDDNMSFTPQAIIDAVSAEKLLGLKFIGYISGHKHVDYLHKPTQDQIEVNVACANRTQGGTNDLSKSDDEIAYNIVVVDTQHTLLKVIRGGGKNIDNLMRTRKAISFDYSTGNMIAEIN